MHAPHGFRAYSSAGPPRRGWSRRRFARSVHHPPACHRGGRETLRAGAARLPVGSSYGSECVDPRGSQPSQWVWLPLGSGLPCETCSQIHQHCPGHFGYIPLPPTGPLGLCLDPAPRHVQSAACLSAYPGAPALLTCTNRVSLLTYVLQTLHRSHPIDGAWRATVHPVPTPAGVTVLPACHVSPTLGRGHASSGDGWAPNLPLPPLIPSTEDYQCNVCSTDPVSVLPGVRPVGRLRRREAETLSFARGRGDCSLHPRPASRMVSPYSPDGPPRWVWGFWCPRTVSMQSWTALAMSI